MPYLVSSSCSEFCSPCFAEAYKNALGKKMHWLFCSFTGESRGFPRAKPVPVEAGSVIHVVGVWLSSAVFFCVEWRRCAEWRDRQTCFMVPVFQEQRCSTSSLFSLLSQLVWWICLSSDLLSGWGVWLGLHINQSVQHCCIPYWLISNLKL